MRISDAEWQWDRSRLTLYFTAEKRVDFRNLVRDLAGMFRTRIELRQIGVRDEAARLTGVGRCGREYCCSTWLKELSPVSLALAKDQHLSLNPDADLRRLRPAALLPEVRARVLRRGAPPLPEGRQDRPDLRGAPRRSSPSTSSGSGSISAPKTRRHASWRSSTSARRWSRPAPDCRNSRRASRHRPDRPSRTARRRRPTAGRRLQRRPKLRRHPRAPPRRPLPAPAVNPGSPAAAGGAGGAAARPAPALRRAGPPIHRLPRREWPSTTSIPPSTTPTAIRISATPSRRSAPTASHATTACAGTRCASSWAWTSTA